MAHLTTLNLTVDEHLLWNRVKQLWKCSIDRDVNTIDRAIHPKYIGWDNNSVVPHNRTYALQSVTDQSTRLIEYDLLPLRITVYDNQVGIVNYRYSATISDSKKNVRRIKGRWTEIYLLQHKKWILIGVHGGTESLKIKSTAKVY